MAVNPRFAFDSEYDERRSSLPLYGELVDLPVPERLEDTGFEPPEFYRPRLFSDLNSPLQVHGGYDYDFVEEVPEELKCETICTKVLRDPHVTDCCGQHFCDTCLQHWFKRKGKKECPHCRGENFTHILYKPARRKIDQLKIYCINRKVGCEWVGELNTIQAHLDSGSGCEYVEVCCINSKCEEKVQRKHLYYHVMQQCPQRKYKCQHCGKKGTYQTITKTHYNECPNYPLDCPNKCGTRGIKRAEMVQHQSKCPLQPVNCPFKVAGCQAKVVRKDLDNHMSTSQQQHLLIVMEAFREAKADLEAVKVEKEVIATDVKILHQSCLGKPSKLALASIESQLEMKSFRLMANGPPLTIRMINFSHYKKSGKVWYSPPFYYGDGYKMQLAVHANGTGAGAGTRVSIILLRMKGEYDDLLKWKEEAIWYEMSIKIVVQKKPTRKPLVSADFSHYICSPNRVSGAENVREEGRKENLDRPILLNDSIVLQVSMLALDEQKTVEDRPPAAPWVEEDRPTAIPWVEEDRPTAAPWVVEDRPPATPWVVEDRPPAIPWVVEDRPPATPWVVEDRPPAIPWVVEDRPPAAPIMRRERQNSYSPMGHGRQNSCNTMGHGRQNSCNTMGHERQNSYSPMDRGRQNSYSLMGRGRGRGRQNSCNTIDRRRQTSCSPVGRRRQNSFSPMGLFSCNPAENYSLGAGLVMEDRTPAAQRIVYDRCLPQNDEDLMTF